MNNVEELRRALWAKRCEMRDARQWNWHAIRCFGMSEKFIFHNLFDAIFAFISGKRRKIMICQVFRHPIKKLIYLSECDLSTEFFSTFVWQNGHSGAMQTRQNNRKQWMMSEMRRVKLEKQHTAKWEISFFSFHFSSRIRLRYSIHLAKPIGPFFVWK